MWSCVLLLQAFHALLSASCSCSAGEQERSSATVLWLTDEYVPKKALLDTDHLTGGPTLAHVDHAEISQDATFRGNPSRTRAWISDFGVVFATPDGFLDYTTKMKSAAMVQPPVLPPLSAQPPTALPPSITTRPPVSMALRDAFGRLAREQLEQNRRTRAIAPSTNIVFGVEAILRATTDAGNLLGESPSILGVEAPRRTPIITGTRIRGGRDGELAASGSYWVPARMDLDTALSKMDSRMIDDVIVIKGPYSVIYGPGFHFVDTQLIRSDRYEDGMEWHGSSSFDYKVNGEQWYGRQTMRGGDSDWGVFVGYGHRTGNDYATGDGVSMPSSYKSRDLDVALGGDLTPESSIEFNYLRLDQTDVEFPGQAFDIDFLVTDGYEMEYVVQDQPDFDRMALDTWYNRTRFAGSAQRPGKKRQFPIYGRREFIGNTDVDSMSTGYRWATSWGDPDHQQLSVGSDLRYINQELNEITSGVVGNTIWFDKNSPIPRSHWSNPGLFVEWIQHASDQLLLSCGTRVDLVSTNIDDDAEKLAEIGPEDIRYSFVVGSDDYDRDFELVAIHATATYEINRCWTTSLACGYAERAPTLTELYAGKPFMFLLQNGLNTVTGDPRLKKERLWQIDAALAYNAGRFRSGINAYHAWIEDYITFENIGIFPLGFGGAEQVNLKFVNTNLATIAGFEFHMEYDLAPRLLSFATLQYIGGRDQDRDGDFATKPATPNSPSIREPGLARGSYGGAFGSMQPDPGAPAEPLPNIRPLESRIGVRLHDDSDQPAWFIELAMRIVDDQSRIATSLFETPTPGFAVWDLRSFWKATDRLLIVAGVENFTDRNYQEYLDFRSQGDALAVFQPGINFYFGSELAY